MEVGEEAASKDVLSSAPTPLTAGNPNGAAPGPHTDETTEVCFKE